MLFEDQGQAVAILKGLDVRLLADAPLSDLRRVEPVELRSYRENLLKRNADCFGASASANTWFANRRYVRWP